MPALTEPEITRALRTATKTGKPAALTDGDGKGTGRLRLTIRPMPTRTLAEWYAVQWHDGKRTQAKLATNTGELRRQLELANGEAAKGSMAREFGARMETTSAQLLIARNRMVELVSTIGGALLPAINSLLQATGPVISNFSTWAQENPRLMQGITALGGAMIAARASSLLLGIGITHVRGAVLGLARVLLTNPIGLAVTAIAGGAYMIYKNWEPISAWFTQTWGNVTAAATKTWEWFKTNLAWNPVTQVATSWNGLTGFFNNMWKDITNTFASALNWITSKISWVGETWQATKSFFGFGSDEAQQTAIQAGHIEPPKFETQANTFADQPAPPPLPAPAASRNAPAVNDQRTINMTVNAAPGMSPDEVAELAVRKMDHRNDRRSRAMLADGAYAQ